MKEELKAAGGLTLAAIIAGGLALIVAVVVGFMWVFGIGFYTDHTADRRGETQKKNQVEGNGSFRIAAYDHFFDLCSGVQANEDKILNLQEELKTTKDATRISIVNATITALRNQRAEDIRQYNVDADKSYTIGQFKASDLPYHLDPTNQETKCTD